MIKLKYAYTLNLLLVMAAALTLGACGGDDDNAPTAAAAPGGGSVSAPPAAGTASTFAYVDATPATSRAQFVANANSQGAQGFRYLSDFAFAGASPAQVSVFVKDLATTWRFEAQNVTTSSADFQTQANAEGARGFRWAGEVGVGGDLFYVYRKDDSSSATYRYQALAQPSAQADFLSQINTQGASGFYNIAPSFSFGDPAIWSLYEKSSAGNSTYGYEIAPIPAADADFIGLLNSEGARGFRFRTELFFSGSTVALYAKDLSQTSTFSFAGLDPATNGDALVQQANGQGANESGLVGELGLPDGKVQTFYFTPGACTGTLCTSVSPFGV